MKIVLNIFLILSLVSCLDSTVPERNLASQGVGSGGSGTGSVIDSDDVVAEDVVKVEIRHLIEPKIDDSGDGGEYKRKMTIPKNYNGLLYLAGINVSSLASKNIKVRFRFGKGLSPKDINATITTAAGLTPQTNVEVLVMDLRSKPFDSIQLPYDLFDYNDYDFSGTSNLPGILAEPVTFNRDDKLFCRGLSLKDDPTFTGDIVGKCQGGDDVCKYAYAKVVDKGLVSDTDPRYYLPTQRAIQAQVTGGYLDDSHDLKIDRCLPDTPFSPSVLSAYQYDENFSFSDFGESLVLPGVGSYTYNGPYFSSDTTNWDITSNALVGEYGVFGEVYDLDSDSNVDSNELQLGYKSKLFPLYSKFSLSKDTEYMGSAIADDPKTLQSMTGNGESLWMDGCNERISTIHDITGESIGSCNVTGTIEIIATNINGEETIIDITDEVKLQLVKPATLNTNGDNVLLSSFQSCSSTSQCGSSSCCINKRCWSKTLVNQCIEDLPNYGNAVTGSQCNSDYQCASLCCDKGSGRCAPHDTAAQTPSYCSKPSGQSCVSKEWCAKTPITTCAIVLGPNDAQGGKTCSLRCVVAEVHGDCVARDGVGTGQCIPPSQPQNPVFNPTDPNRCNDAITFEQLEQLAGSGS